MFQPTKHLVSRLYVEDIYRGYIHYVVYSCPAIPIHKDVRHENKNIDLSLPCVL